MIMKSTCKAVIHLAILISLISCTAEISKVADDVLTDNAVTLEVQKGALGKETDIHVTIDVVNKDAPKK